MAIHQLDVNKHAALTFVKKAEQFLLFPRKLWECDVKKCEPSLYYGNRGGAAVRRAKKALVLLRKAELNLLKIKKLLK